jgi:hypothetical protein
LGGRGSRPGRGGRGAVPGAISGRFSSGPRARAAATDSANALAAADGRLPIQADSICLTRSVSALRRSRSNLECLATVRPFAAPTGDAFVRVYPRWAGRPPDGRSPILRG